MTRVETIFGSVLAAGILAVFAFVFFGQGTVVQASAARTTAAYTGNALFDREDDYEVPATLCDCYNYAYDYARAGIPAGSVDYEGQTSICYDLFGPNGATAFQQGYSDVLAEPRERRSCPFPAQRRF